MYYGRFALQSVNRDFHNFDFLQIMICGLITPLKLFYFFFVLSVGKLIIINSFLYWYRLCKYTQRVISFFFIVIASLLSQYFPSMFLHIQTNQGIIGKRQLWSYCLLGKKKGGFCFDMYRMPWNEGWKSISHGVRKGTVYVWIYSINY